MSINELGFNYLYLADSNNYFSHKRQPEDYQFS